MAVPGAWRTRIIVGIAPLVGACAAMLGIDELPLASRDAGAIDAEPPDTAGADACDSPDASFCTRACPAYDFCDDFEDEGPDFHRWKAPSVIPNPFRVGPFGATLDLVPSPPEHGTVLVAQAETEGKQEQTIGLIEVVPQPRTGATPRAILTRVKGRLGELTFPDTPGLSRRAALFGMGSSELPLPMAVLVIYERGTTLDLAIQQRRVGLADDTNVLLVKGVPRVALEAAFPEVELAMGFRSALLANKLPCTIEAADAPEDAGADATEDADADAGAPADDPVVVYVRALGFSRCAALVAPLADPAWLSSAVVFAGASISDFGRVKFTFDDVGTRLLF